MTPIEKQQFEEMNARLEAIEKGLNLDATTSFINSLIKRAPSVTDSTVSNSIGAGGGSTFDFPDQWIEITYRGTLYRLPAYVLSRF